MQFKKMLLHACRRCRGDLFLIEDEYVCLQCGDHTYVRPSGQLVHARRLVRTAAPPAEKEPAGAGARAA